MIWAYNTRILAIFAVVVLHVAGVVVLDEKSYLTMHSWIAIFFDIYMRWAVATFVMLSGALLLADDKREPLGTFYKKRASKLLIPLVFWTAFYLVWDFFQRKTNGIPLPLPTQIKNVMLGTPYYHMWFIYMITGLYFAAPYVRILIRNMTQEQIVWFTVALFVMAMATDAFNNLYAHNKILFFNRFLLFLPYFILGHLIQKSDWKPNIFYPGLIILVSGIMMACGYYAMQKIYGPQQDSYFFSSMSITGVPMSISAILILKQAGRPIVNIDFTKKLASLVLGIYLIHPFILDVLIQVGIKPAQFNPIYWIPVYAVFAFMISALAARIIQATPHLKRII